MRPLRRRTIENMTIRNFGPKTHHDYIRSVRSLTVFLGRSPDTASNEDVRRFQLRLAYNSCRNRHCPKCQGVAAKQWLGTLLRGMLLEWRVACPRRDGELHRVFPGPGNLQPRP